MYVCMYVLVRMPEFSRWNRKERLRAYLVTECRNFVFSQNPQVHSTPSSSASSSSSSYTHQYQTFQILIVKMVSVNSNSSSHPSFVGPFHLHRRSNTRIIVNNSVLEPEPQLNSVTPRPRPRALDNDRGNALLNLLTAPQPSVDVEAKRANEIFRDRLAINSLPRHTMPKIRHSTSNIAQTLPLRGLTASVLRAVCARAISPDPIKEIYYWTPRYGCWTEARASGSLRLMKASVRDMDRVHVFVLRKKVGMFKFSETVADLPFMRSDGFLQGDTVPVEGRRGRKLSICFGDVSLDTYEEY